MEKVNGFIIVVKGEDDAEDDFCDPVKKLAGDVEQLDYAVTEVRKEMEAARAFIKASHAGQIDKLRRLDNELDIVSRELVEMRESMSKLRISLAIDLSRHVSEHHGEKH